MPDKSNVCPDEGSSLPKHEIRSHPILGNRENLHQKMIMKTPLIALVLLPLVLLLHNYNEVFGFITIGQVIFPAFIFYSGIAILYFIFHRANMPQPKIAIILFILSLFVLAYTPIHKFFVLITFNSILGKSLVLIPLWTFLFVVFVKRLRKGPVLAPKLILFINILMICLFLTEIVNVCINTIEVSKTRNLIYPQFAISENYSVSNLPDSLKPDIYFIVFDEYTNNKTLKRIWNYDNSEITNWLKVRGFYVPEHTQSNYSYTLFSLSSTFNMNYLDSKKGADATVARNVLQASNSLGDNELFSILRKEGYSVNFIAPFVKGLQLYLGGEHQIYMQTLPGNLYNLLKWQFVDGNSPGGAEANPAKLLIDKYELTKGIIRQIKESTDTLRNRKPHFVYGHLMTTHEPHMFDSTGKIMSEKMSANTLWIHSYPSQIAPSNEMMKDLVDFIQSHNKRNTIIVVEGDHGFRGFRQGSRWLTNTPDSLKKCFFPNFDAIYFPGENYSSLYESMSPVNLFRILFNQYLNQDFPLLKDSTILVKDE